MSKVITSVVMAVIAWAVASFIIGANPNVPFTAGTAAMIFAVLGLIIG